MSEMAEFQIGQNTWESDLELSLLPQDLEYLPSPDRDAIFNGIVEELERKNFIIERHSDSVIGSSAPLLVPNTRIFVKGNELIREWLIKTTKIISLYVIVGNMDPFSSFAGLTIDLVIDIFEKISLLSDDEVLVINTILNIRKKGLQPTLKKISGMLKKKDVNVNSVMATLEKKGVIKNNNQRWIVVF
jgi:hypothetical protein